MSNPSYTYKDWGQQVIWELGGKLGGGAFSTVHRAKNKQTGNLSRLCLIMHVYLVLLTECYVFC